MKKLKLFKDRKMKNKCNKLNKLLIDIIHNGNQLQKLNH